MPTLLNTFTSSVATGEGIGADYSQVVRIEAGSGIVPIGCIIPWLKSFVGVPTLATQNVPTIFLECDGSVISDSDSPLNGQTLPNLNGDHRFVRGNSTSGGTGGSTSTSGNSSWELFCRANYNRNAAQSSHSHTGNEPPYYNVVWLMRVK